MRILVTGGRSYPDRARVFAELEKHEPTVVIHGACTDRRTGELTGADRWADEYAQAKLGGALRFPADWASHGNAAGPIRNRQMLREGKPDLVLAFAGGRGTSDCVAAAREAGVRVLVVEQQFGPIRISTPAEFIRYRHELGLHCPKCKTWRTADMAQLVAQGRGDQPVAKMRFVCRDCRTPMSAVVRPPVPER